jgi:hypothetical protein
VSSVSAKEAEDTMTLKNIAAAVNDTIFFFIKNAPV